MNHTQFRQAKFITTMAIGAVVLAAIAYFVISGANSGVEIKRVIELGKACGTNGVKVKNAASYKTGTAPYPAALALESVTEPTDPAQNVYSTLSVVREAPLGEAIRAGKDVSKVQLIGCVDRVSETQTDQTCQFEDNITLTVYDATYKLNIYEAKTHKELKSVDIAAKPDYECNDYTAYGENKRAYKEIDLQKVADEFKPFVQ